MSHREDAVLVQRMCLDVIHRKTRLWSYGDNTTQMTCWEHAQT